MATRRAAGKAGPKRRLRSPVQWFGGKGNMAAKLVRLLPAHREYIEPFFGGGSVFFAKAPAAVETINDLNSAVMGFFRVLRDYPDEFLRLARLTQYSRELYNECRNLWRDEIDDVRRAWRWWVVVRQSFAGHHGWGTSITSTARGMAKPCSSLLCGIDGLPAVVDRLQQTQIECEDALRVLERCCTPNSLAYCDPPYIQTLRRSGQYEHETTDADHAALVDALLRLPGRFVLSGYAHPLYEPLESAGWVRLDIETACMAAGRTRGTGILGTGAATSMQPRTESVWLDPATAAEVLPQEELCYG